VPVANSTTAESSSQAPASSTPVNTTSSAPSSTPSSYDPFEFDPCLPYNGTYTTSTGETYQVRSFTDNNYASYNNTPAPNGPSDCFTICDTAGNCRGWTYARSGPPGSVGNCYLRSEIGDNTVVNGTTYFCSAQRVNNGTASSSSSSVVTVQPTTSNAASSSVPTSSMANSTVSSSSSSMSTVPPTSSNAPSSSMPTSMENSTTASSSSSMSTVPPTSSNAPSSNMLSSMPNMTSSSSMISTTPPLSTSAPSTTMLSSSGPITSFPNATTITAPGHNTTMTTTVFVPTTIKPELYHHNAPLYHIEDTYPLSQVSQVDVQAITLHYTLPDYKLSDSHFPSFYVLDLLNAEHYLLGTGNNFGCDQDRN
ncbi:hypothetical protein KC334_g20260, partial [Hortaea werneckii]